MTKIRFLFLSLFVYILFILLLFREHVQQKTNDFQESMQKILSTSIVEIQNNHTDNKLLSFRKIYICGWEYAPLLHSQFFPEHREGLKSAIQLGTIKDHVLHTLQNATEHDWFISGGVTYCRNDELKLGFDFRQDYMWHQWLKDNFKGTYLVCKFQFHTEIQSRNSLCSLLLIQK